MSLTIHAIQNNSEKIAQLDGLASRMERLAATPNREHFPGHSASSEVLLECLMVLGTMLPSEDRRAIDRITTAYDKL